MKIKIFSSLIIIFFFITFVIFYKGLNNSNIYTPNTDIKKNIPSFTAKLLETNNSINSDEIFKSNKFYLMNIWASWCIPCRDEHYLLLDLTNQYNLEIVGLNYKDKLENAKNFLKELNNPYNIILLDKDGTIGIEWGAYGVPETFLIYDKKIIKKFIGPLTASSFLEIKKIIE